MFANKILLFHLFSAIAIRYWHHEVTNILLHSPSCTWFGFYASHAQTDATPD